MAAATRRLPRALPLLALLLLYPCPPAAQARGEPDRRFAELKRCADPECSMLMCRGKAVKDFKVPDCRFVDFKEGESVYVYYKLAGRNNELWAGSVGNEFGYFPKDLLEINHIYTHDELELPTDETDFACFVEGKDDFDNYNVDDLLKLSEDIAAGDAEAEVEVEKEEETEEEDSAEPVDPQGNDPEVASDESSKDHIRVGEQDNFLFERDENIEGALDSKSENLAVNSNIDHPQGDQSAHQPLEEEQETLEVPEHGSAKNSSNSQGETKLSNYEGKDDGAFTLLQREESEELKTAFGSTADALVTDDETTSLVTSLEADLMEDTDIDSRNADKLKEPKEQSEEIHLLSFTEEEITSSYDPEAEKMLFEGIHESEISDLGVIEEGVTKSTDKNKEASGLLTNIGDTIFAIVNGGEKMTDQTNGDRADVEADEEVEDEVVIISKNENEENPHSEDVSSKNDPLTSHHDHITKKLQNRDVQDLKERNAETQDDDDDNSKSEADPGAQNQFQSPSMHNFGAFSNYRDGLESKASMETKEESLKPPMGNIKDDPEGLSLHKIIQDEERVRESILEDSVENDTKHKTLWEELDKQDDENKESMNIASKVMEELTNGFQSDLDDTGLSMGKTKHGTQQGREDSELTEMFSRDKQTSAFAAENVSNEGNTDETLKKSKGGTKSQYLDDSEGLTKSIKKQTLEKKSIVEKSMSPTQYGNLTQQNIVHNEAEHMDKVIGANTAGGKSSTTEVQPVEMEAEEDNFLEGSEQELLPDENMVSAKLSKERLADEESFTLDVQSASPQVEMPDDAISRVDNPVDETGEEAMTTLEQVEKEDSMPDLNGEYERLQLNEASQMRDMIESIKEEKEEVEPSTSPEIEKSVVEEKNLIQDLQDKMPNNFNISEVEDNKDDFNETQEHLTEDSLQKKLINKHQHSYDSSKPSSVSRNKEEAIGPEYSESVKELNIMKAFLDEKRIARLQKYLGQQHVFRIESLFHDMELELMLAQKQNNNYEDAENALDQILEFSESNILGVVDKILDSRETENKEEVVKEIDLFDEEAALMDDIQELMYSLRHKYSPISESAPLASPLESEMDSSVLIPANAKQTEDESPAENTDQKLPPHTDQMSKEQVVLQLDEPKEDVNVLKETGTVDKKEGSDIPDSEKKLSPVGTLPEPVDSRTNTKNDFISGTSNNKDNPIEEHSNPSVDTGAPKILAAFNRAILLAKENMQPITELLVSTLPEEMQPGPDFHGLPWEPVVLTAFVGIVTIAIFFWRTCLSVKSRMYQVTEKQLVEKIKNLIKEKAEVLEKLSQYDQKIREAKESVKEVQKQNAHLSEEAAGLKGTVKKLKEANNFLDNKARNLEATLEIEKEQNLKNQKQITETQKSLEKLQEDIALYSVELSEVQISLNEAKLSEEKVKSELHRVQEENARLKKSKEQLLQEAEGWTERHAELSEQIKMYQKSQKDTEEALAYKENEIEVLSNCIMQLKQLDADSEPDGKNDEGNDLANGELSGTRNEKMKNQIKQMMDVSRVKTTLSIIEEDRELLKSKLNDEVAARHELEEQIKKLEHDTCSLQTAKTQLESESKTLQQKVEILNELYQEKEMALQKKLTQEEYERQEKEQKLSAADEKAILAVEEVKVYKQRIQEMDEELQKTERSYKNQIAMHEKKAHDNWLIARSAERALAEEKREAANLRQKLTEVNQKLAVLQRPLILKPTPGRPDQQVPPRRGPLSRDGSFGPSPVSGGDPSPPLMMEPPVRPLSANPREGSRTEFGVAAPDGPPVPRRHSELSGRISAPDLGPAAASLMNCGPRTSSPSSTVLDGMVGISPKGPSSLPGTPIMTSPATGPLPPPARFGPPSRSPFGPRPLPVSLMRGAPPPPFPRDYPPGPPFGMRDFPPGPLPPPEHRGYLRGPPPFRPPNPRDYPPRLPPQGLRDYPPPPVRDLPPSGPSNYQGPPCPPSPASSQDSEHHPEQKP